MKLMTAKIIRINMNIDKPFVIIWCSALLAELVKIKVSKPKMNNMA